MPCTSAIPWEPQHTHRASRTSHWRLVPDEDVVVQTESTAWNVAVTWYRHLWAVAPQPWRARERDALTAGYPRALADWVVLPPPTRWSRLIRAGGREWPVGLCRPFADAGTLAAPPPCPCWTPRNAGRARTWSSASAPHHPCGVPSQRRSWPCRRPARHYSRATPSNRSANGPCWRSRQARRHPASSRP